MNYHVDPEILVRSERASQHLAAASRELARVAIGGYRSAPASEFALTPAERAEFDLARAIRAAADPVEMGAAHLELRVRDRARAAGLLRNDGTVYVPYEVLMRDLAVGVAGAGGNLVAKDAPSAVAWLRPASAVLQAGATTIEGLSSNLAIPRFTAGSAVQLVAENTAGNEGNPTFDQVVLTPKTVTAYVDYSRRLGLQTADRPGGIGAMISADLSDAIAAMVDLMALTGAGGNQPTGVLNTAGIGSVSIGANGGAMTWAALTDLEYQVVSQNENAGRVALGYVTNPKVRRQLQQTQILTSGRPIWHTEAGQETIAGTPAWPTANVPSNLTKGTSNNCSALVYGNWARVVIGMWGQGLEITVDPYSQSSSGTVRICAMLDFDVALRRAQSFAAVSDIVAP